MKLRLWSEAGEEKEIAIDPGPAGHAAILAAVASTDWEHPGLSGVTVERAAGCWADGSGSLDPGVGLSLMVEQESVQHVSVRAPTDPNEIAQFLGAYFAGDFRQVFKILYERAPTEAELLAFVSPGPPAPVNVAKASFGVFIVVILLGALFAHCGAR